MHYIVEWVTAEYLSLTEKKKKEKKKGQLIIDQDV